MRGTPLRLAATLQLNSIDQRRIQAQILPTITASLSGSALRGGLTR
jgi:hypothetical protein